jgi:lysyl-tRNA synthetase class 2
MSESPRPIAAPWWRPDRFAHKRAFLHRRAAMLRQTRDFFHARGFLEVDPPALQVSPGLEPHLHAVAADLHRPEGTALRRYLHTSPEFTMKKLLAAGERQIYALGHVWRDREGSDTHSPEFTMLEWYRVGANYRDLMADCEGLIRAVTAGEPLRRGDLTVAVTEPFERLTVAEAFQKFCEIDLLASAPDPKQPGSDAPAAAILAQEALRLGVRVADDDRWDDIVFRLMFDFIEPHLGRDRPTFLIDYPISMAALARPKPEDPRLAERFELYAAGVELANAFGELTDAEEQRARFVADMDLKQALYGERYPIDEDFLAALAHGLPASAGIALGFDRLVLLATGAERLSDVLWAEVQ